MNLRKIIFLLLISVISCKIQSSHKNDNIEFDKTIILLSKSSENYTKWLYDENTIFIDAYNSENIDSILLIADGIVLTGGEDINPKEYNDTLNIPLCGTINYRRDTLERTIFNYALKAKIPFVGICRGMQMMNVACGGTLYGDIPTQIGNKVTHRNKGEVMHDIYLVDTSSLIFPIKTDTFNVNSWHHQGLNLIADNIRVLARSYDGLPEAVIMKKKIHPYMIAVQFHPERLGNQNIISKTIKNSFYRAIKQHND